MRNPSYAYVGPKPLSPLARTIVINMAALAVGVTGIIHVATYIDVAVIPLDILDFVLLGLPLVPALWFDRYRVCREWTPPLPYRGGVPGAPSYISLPRWALRLGRLSFVYLAVLFIVFAASSIGDKLRCVELGGYYFLKRGTFTQHVSRSECLAQDAPFYRFWSGLLFVSTLGLALNWTVRRKAILPQDP